MIWSNMIYPSLKHRKGEFTKERMLLEGCFLWDSVSFQSLGWFQGVYWRRHAKVYLRYPPPTAPGNFQVFLWNDGFESFRTIYFLWSSLGIYILNLKAIAPQGAALLFEKLLGWGATFQTTMSAMLDWLKDLPRDGHLCFWRLTA